MNSQINKPNFKVELHFGEWDRDQPEPWVQYRYNEKVIVHPAYDVGNDWVNDIALIKLNVSKYLFKIELKLLSFRLSIN